MQKTEKISSHYFHKIWNKFSKKIAYRYTKLLGQMQEVSAKKKFDLGSPILAQKFTLGAR